MIQDIAPHRLDNHFEGGRLPTADSPVIAFRGRNVLLHTEEDGSFRLPTARELGADVRLSYLIRMDGTDYFFPVKEIPNPDIPDGYAYLGIRDIRRSGKAAPEQAMLLVTALHLANWYRHNRFCGACGSPTEIDTLERAMVCPKCGNIIFPRINPAVIVGIRNGDSLLLTEYAARTGQSLPFYALVAGFAEIGETFEECVQREVMEEVGLKVKNIRYYKSQPWGFADDLLAGYYCDVDGDPTIHMDTNELKTAIWVPRSEIQLQWDSMSLTNEMMRMFKEGRDEELLRYPKV